MHRLLQRQIKRFFDNTAPQELAEFFEAVDAAYTDNDTDRLMIERRSI